jgi:hypothetical protein
MVVMASAHVFAATSTSIATVVHHHNGGPVEVLLRALRVGGADTPIQQVVSVPGNHPLQLPPGNWEVTIESPALWSQPVVVTQSEAARIDLWPIGFVHGTFKGQRKRTAIDALRVLFTAVDRANAETADFPVSGETRCAVDGTAWRCPVPAGRYDLRLVARGYAAEFRWDQLIPAGKDSSLGTMVMRPGASLSGFVNLGRDVQAEMTSVVVTAKPRAGATLPQRSYSSPVTRRGFFQIAGLPAGEYSVSAGSGKLRSSDRTVTILEERSAELRAPLIVDLPRKLTVRVTGPREAPPLWHIRLYSVMPGPRLENAAAGLTDAEGKWTAQLPPGEYLLQVGRSETSKWRSADITVGEADVDFDVQMPGRLVSGTVTLGSVPLADAQLIFGGEQGSEQETLVTDGEGKFTGVLPEPRDESDWTITIASDQPRVKRTVHQQPKENDGGSLEFVIDLPRTAVTGRVVNEDGSGEGNAIVTLRSPDGSVFEQVGTDDDGAFVLFGFEPGTYRVRADAARRSTAIVNVDATQDVTAPVQLVLRDEVAVRGRVQSRTTSGVEANLTALQRGVRSDFVPIASSDARGMFELWLPPGTRVFDLLVQAPGFAASAGRIAVVDDKFLTITVDQNGGSLSLEFPAGADPVLKHDGAEFRARWFATTTGGRIDALKSLERATIANVEAGEYTLCAGNQCKSGVVTPQGSLALALAEQ